MDGSVARDGAVFHGERFAGWGFCQRRGLQLRVANHAAISGDPYQKILGVMSEGRGLLFEKGLPRFRGRFSVNTVEAVGEIERIFEAATVRDFLDRQAGSSEQSHGKLELEEAKCLHGRVP